VSLWLLSNVLGVALSAWATHIVVGSSHVHPSYFGECCRRVDAGRWSLFCSSAVLLIALLFRSWRLLLVVSSPSFSRCLLSPCPRCSRLLLVIFSSVCIRTASVYLYLYLGVCSLFYVLSPVALLPVPPVVVGDLPPLVCRSPVAVFFLVFSFLHASFLPILAPPCY
jgi:hypothetical protein